jgi:hypothetical protein
MKLTKQFGSIRKRAMGGNSQEKGTEAPGAP